jgi:hypothetical protein
VTFIHPLALLGLAAAAIPALLHLLQRRVPPELEFPAVRYLSAAERESARRLKLRHILLLVLRTALVIVIVLAAARPLIRVHSWPGGRSGEAHAPTALVVILDNSPSSGAVVSGRVVLDRLRVAAHSSISRTTSADRIWLMLADGVLRGGTREALLASVDSVKPAWQRLDLVSAVERAARLVNAQPFAGREVHVLSDLQRSALMTGRANVPRGIRVLALEAGPAIPNHGIAAVRVTEGAAVIELAGSIGEGGARTEPVPVTIRIGTQRGEQSRGEIAARGLATPADRTDSTSATSVVTVSLPARSLTPGWWIGEAALEPDELRADDRRPFAWRVAAPARVNATPDAGAFVSAALGVLREAHRVMDGREVVITGGIAPAFVRAILEPPADPALLGQANRALASRGVPWRWSRVATPGPIVARQLPSIDSVQVVRRYRLESSSGEAGDTLATVNGEPWLVRSGAVVLMGSRLDTAWTALPASPGFVPFVDALVNRLVRGEADVSTAEGAPRVEFRVRGTDTIGATVFGPDPRESDLTPAKRADALAALGGHDRAEVLSEGDLAESAFSGIRRADISGLLLILALLLAFTELGVATRTR